MEMEHAAREQSPASNSSNSSFYAPSAVTTVQSIRQALVEKPVQERPLWQKPSPATQLELQIRAKAYRRQYFRQQ
jgi:hypothetical protein